MSEETENFVFGFFLMFGLIVLMIIAFNTLNNPTKEMNNFCIENGYNKATDYIIKECQNTAVYIYNNITNYTSLKLECDKKKILIVEAEEICGRYDKWGRCDYKVIGNYKLSNRSCI